MDDETVKLPFQILVDKNKLKNEFERILIECSNSVFIGLSAINNLNEDPEYLMGEDEFMFHKPFLIQMPLEESKKFFKTWIIKKGFEDLIKAVTFLLIDVCKVLNKKQKLVAKQPETWEEVQEILNSLEHNLSKEHYPALIERIKPYLTEPLSYIDEINSINRVRRCLVHRDGIITSIDFTTNLDYLQLKWVYNKLYYQEREIKKPFVPFTIITANGSIIMEEDKKEMIFSEGQQVMFDYQVFNEFIWTVFRFGEDLIYKLTFEKQS